MAGTISKRSTNTWIVRIFLGRDVNGRTRHFNKTIHGTKKDAQRYLTAKLREKDLGHFVDPASETLAGYMLTWLRDIAKVRVREATFVSYESIASRYVIPNLGSFRLCDLRPDHIQGFYGKLTARGLSARTVRYAHSVLSSALTHAERQGMIGANPCKRCSLPRKQATEMKYLGPEEVKRFLEVAATSDMYPLFLLAIETGMRPGEYLALQWSDLDFATGFLTVRRTVKIRVGGGYYFSTPKTSKGSRPLFVSQNVLQALKLHRRRQLEARIQLGPAYRENDLIFANALGDPLLIGNLRRRHFEPLLKEAGIGKIRLYDLRHTSATLLLASGEHPKVVAERLGHASTNLTLDTYSHVIPSMQMAATERIQKLMFGTG